MICGGSVGLGPAHDVARGHDEIGRPVLLDDDAVLGEVGLHLLRIAGVVHDEALEHRRSARGRECGT